ncbi:MAG: RsmB/NOP family class I SAM-dependent RNA methyltransferase [Alphaproteobacteria bacterium]|nr:RsmB/NOP family class I SAM-dependent RNA methyltransferase [Alphaproteobacteria bacterium]
MKPEQIQIAANELLQLINDAPCPANEVINAYTRSRRYIGSKDRRALTDIVWQTIKQMPTPEWLKNYIPQKELNAMRGESRTILRVNGNREQVQKQLSEQGIESTLTTLSPLGLILKKRTNLNVIPEYKNGLVEVQDEGSQLLALSTGIKPNENVLDYCAGAGGKSLCFAQMMHNKGKIVAHDISAISLKELEKRAKRANTTIINTTLHPTGLFDHVVVDAPCSGSGTWRRNPDGRLKLTQKQLKDVIKKQSDILNRAKQFVKAGGKLHYMTCSLIADENINQIRAFLRKNANFRLCHHQQWTPATTNTDGFFLATIQKTK